MSNTSGIKSKPRILLCWGYHRKGWLHALKPLNPDFEFHYLFYLQKPENEDNFSGSRNLHYWSDFSSAQELIDKIKPETIVFMGIESLPTIALNIVAKSNKIETIVLQHGMFHSYADYRNLALEEIKQRNKTGEFSRSSEQIDRRFLFWFFVRSVAIVNPFAVFYVLKLQLLKRRNLEIDALRKARSNFRTPSKYVVFTKSNASIYKERDGIDPEKLIEIGNPELDEYFKYTEQPRSEETAYYLLIDQPWAEVKDYGSPGYGISKEQTNEFYLKLSRFAEMNGARLKIKLHPYSFKSDFFIEDPNIDYIKDAEMVDLIMNSKGVFGFSSTLLLPAIYFKQCCLIQVWEQSSFQQRIKSLGLAQVLDYHSFTENDIRFDAISEKPETIKKFIAEYIYKADGGAVDRLRALLLSGINE